MDYKNAGVDIEAGYKSVELMKQHIAKTMRPEVLGGIGGFSGAFSMNSFKDMEEPTLVSGTDGVGTKLKLAFIMDKHDTVGIDCVAMCVNDIACAGGEPLFFLDYIACGKNYPEKIAQIVSGVAEGCVQSDAALIGGETAEHPGLMPEEEYDLAGFAVGVCDRKEMITGENLKDGDVLIGMASTGVHSNGFSLVRKVFDMTVETNAKGAPLIVKYTVSLDLQTVTHEGVMFTDTENGFWNLECADITEQNGKYFLTYSGQPEDTVWYAVSDEKFSGYGKPQRLEGKHFYAPKVVEGDKGTFLVGWVYRRAGFSDDSDLYWGGHLVAHKMQFNEDDSVTLLPVDGLDAYFGYENELLCAPSVRFSGKQRNKLANGAESYMITGSFAFEGSERFGFVLGYDDEYNRYLSYDPEKQTFAFSLRSNTVSECEIKTELEAGKKYDFVYIQEGSVGVFYILNECALSFRIHGINNKQIGLFSDGSTVSFENLSQYLRSKAVK